MSKTITLNFPESAMQHFEQVAAVTQRSIEQLVMQSAINNLPPMPSVLYPEGHLGFPELQQELSQMQQQDVAIVLQIAKSGVDLQQFQRHSELLELNQEGALTLEEQLELTAAYSCETRSAIGKVLVESNNSK